MICTWLDPPDTQCTLTAIHPHTSEDGSVWANLCEMHHVVLEHATDQMMEPSKDGKHVKWMLRCWVRASGGAKKMARSMSSAGRS